VGVGDRLATFGLYFVDNLLRRAGVFSLARDRGADVVDDDFRTLGRHGVREVAADAAARAGDDDDFSFEGHVRHAQSLNEGSRRSSMRSIAGHSSSVILRRWPGA